MKTFHNIIKTAAGLLFLAVIAVSCVPEQQSMGDAGQTLVKLNPSGFTLLALDAKETPQTGTIFEVRRDAHSQAALNSSTTVVLTFDSDTALLKAYNDDEGTEFIPLPTSLATTTPAVSGGKVTLEFGPGEYSKPIVVNVPNSTLFDFSKQYALAYTLTSVSGTGVLSEASEKTIISQVLVKNKWDGKYEVTAESPMVDVLNALFTTYEPFDYLLETSGGNTCLCFDNTVWGDYMHPMVNNGATSGYGSFGLELIFDPATNKITGINNPWGNPPSNTRMPVLDPTGINAWDPVTRNIMIKYWMIQPSLVPDPPHIRVYFNEKWTYKGPR